MRDVDANPLAARPQPHAHDAGRPRNETSWEPTQRYPDARVRALRPSFRKYMIMNAAVEKLAGGCRWSEGPVWFGDHRCLLWSDIPSGRILRLDEETGRVSTFRRPSNNANGNTRDREGRLVTCEHLTRRVTRTEHDGAITVLADAYDGKRLNSPNDVVVAADGGVWFTDPPFGVLGDYEGERAEPELPQRVYRLDPATGRLAVAAEGIEGPNGLAFSPDGATLYVVECRTQPRRILAFPVRDAGGGGAAPLGKGRVFVTAEPEGTPDGFRVDEDGNLWCGWGMGGDDLDGVRVFDAGGEPIGHVSLPERCANVAFGGRHRNRLFMAASRSLYAVWVGTRGVAGG